MRRLLLFGSLLANFALTAGLLYYERPPEVRSPGAGETIVIVRPTGEFVTGANGSGEPQEKTERVTLRIVKRQGEPAICPAGTTPWRVTVCGTTYVTSPVTD